MKKNENLKNKKIKTIDSLIYVIIIIIIILSILFIIKKKNENETKIEIENSFIPYIEIEKEEEENIEDIIKKEIEDLRIKYNNNDIIGVISIKGGKLNTPVVQSKDNKYYLNHTLDKKRSVIGAVFMDYRLNINSKQINIYGHNSTKYNPPFKELENYIKEDYFNKNKILELKINDTLKTYEIFSVVIAKKEPDEEHMKISFKNNKEFIEHINKLKNRSLYESDINIDDNDNILILQTCIYGRYNGKLIVLVARELK